MGKKPSSIFFDKNDHQLLRIVNDVIDREDQSQTLRSLLVEHLHPHGIKEMAAPRGLRIAYAIASLLGSFEKGKSSDRIIALRSLRDEVFLSSSTFYQKNTARVLLQIMKDLLRSRSDKLRQLKLAHDFRMVSTGNPRKVRTELAKYHLIEMPEEWNQYAFDHHVHDANTKGRKSPTHLIMDAWIKGIRHLTVVYYNFVSPEVVNELLEASNILKVKIQVGIEFSCIFRNKYIRFTWEPSSFTDNHAFRKFLDKETVSELMKEGQKVSRYQQKYVFEALKAFNLKHRQIINDDLQISLNPLQLSDFLQFVGEGQPSLLHLARFIHNSITDQVQRQLSDITINFETLATSEKERVHQHIERIGAMSVEAIMERFLAPTQNKDIHNPTVPRNSTDLPELLQLDPKTLLSRLLSTHSSSKFTLNLSNLSVQDTLELLYSCEGMISHIEAYNLKDASHGMKSGQNCREHYEGETVDLRSPEKNYGLISDLQNALNEDNVISLKRAIRAIIWDHEEQTQQLKKRLDIQPEEHSAGNRLELEYQDLLGRKKSLMNILYNLEAFHGFYKLRTLNSHIGSGSTGQAEHQHGMGLVVLDTLPSRVIKMVHGGVAQKKRTLIPVSALITKNTHRCYHDSTPMTKSKKFLHRLPFMSRLNYQQWQDWQLDGLHVHPPKLGNIATLGGLSRNGDNTFNLSPKKETLDQPWKYLNTNLKNTLKVTLGFIPAFFTFALTKDWWLLAYFGAFIWFGITGSRNIIQSVLGGGGLSRSPLLPWNSLVSWSRIADSLLYTGFSVPLLDYFVKTLLLDRYLCITTATNPVMLYAVMGLANGIYISGHNTFRGLPKSAAVGNFFRSILAIPLAISLNALLGSFLPLFGVVDVTGGLQKWAAIISKFASDCVAAIIEGLADRQINIRARLMGYRTKISQLFAVFSRLDLHFPEEDVLDMLQSPKMTIETLNYEARDQEKLIIVNALDLMYFWMLQPRARKALEILVQSMTKEEWLIFYRSQLVLKRHKEISQVFVDGLVGKHFSKALSFYLDRSEEYLANLEGLGLRWHKL